MDSDDLNLIDEHEDEDAAMYFMESENTLELSHPVVVNGISTETGNDVNISNVITISATLDDDDIHCHKPLPKPNKKARNQLIVVCVLCVTFMLAELAGGIISGSLALMTDCTHLASDIAGFLVSLFAIWLSGKPATMRMSFGFHRAEIIGALVSILMIWVITGVLCYLAVERLINMDFEIKANEMLITASLGLLFNIIMGAVLHLGLCCSCDVPHGHSHGSHGHSHGSHDHSNGSHGHSNGTHGHSNGTHGHSHVSDGHLHESHGNSNESYGHPNESHVHPYGPHGHSNGYLDQSNQPNLPDINDRSDGNNTGNNVPKVDTVETSKERNINVRAAFIHVIGDFIQSVGVFIAAIIIKVEPDYKIADPICTFLFSILVLITTITVLRDVILVMMEAVPRNISYTLIRKDLCSIDGVKTAHSLHIWALSMDKIAVIVHLAIDKDTDWNRVVKYATKILKDKHGIFQTTVQVEVYQEYVMKNCTQCIGPTVKKQV